MKRIAPNFKSGDKNLNCGDTNFNCGHANFKRVEPDLDNKRVNSNCVELNPNRKPSILSRK